MKKIVISIAMVCMCGVSAQASFDPGAPVGVLNDDPTYTLYDNHAPPVGDPGTYVNNGISSIYTLNLNQVVVSGDVILLENGASQNRANWSDVLNFSTPNVLPISSIATLTSYDGLNAAAFWAGYTPSANAVYIQETGGQYTIYTAGLNVYQIDSTVVPEPTTVIAGALLLLPLGASTLRMLRKGRMA